MDECTTGTSRCEDGICRAICPAYNGCPSDKPLTCANGYCAKDMAECAGESRCPSTKPFRCVNNQCAAEP